MPALANPLTWLDPGEVGQAWNLRQRSKALITGRSCDGDPSLAVGTQLAATWFGQSVGHGVAQYGPLQPAGGVADCYLVANCIAGCTELAPASTGALPLYPADPDPQRQLQGAGLSAAGGLAMAPSSEWR